jgi:hypothetical protein
MSTEHVNTDFNRQNSSNAPGSINEDDDHFARAHGGLHEKRSKHHDGHEALGWQHLVKPPVIRQWLYRGRLFKGKNERQATYVELFFGQLHVSTYLAFRDRTDNRCGTDLTFVGIIHQLAETAVEPTATGLNVAK